MDAIPHSRKPLFALLLPVILLLLATGGKPRADELSPGIGDLYRWGEFDSLIRYLEPWLATRSVGADAREDTLAMAQANLYLGVAYWASGKGELGDQAFRRACRLDSTLRMETLYATPEITARFERISSEVRASRPARPGASSASRPGLPPAPPGPSPGPRRKGDSGRDAGWKVRVLGGLAAAALAAGAGYAYYRLAERKPTAREVPVGSE